MQIRNLCTIFIGLDRLSEATDSPTPEIVNALVGVCFDEEEAGVINSYLKIRNGTLTDFSLTDKGNE